MSGSAGGYWPTLRCSRCYDGERGTAVVIGAGVAEVRANRGAATKPGVVRLVRRVRAIRVGASVVTPAL